MFGLALAEGRVSAWRELHLLEDLLTLMGEVIHRQQKGLATSRNSSQKE
jgi:hypothetical protein